MPELPPISWMFFDAAAAQFLLGRLLLGALGLAAAVHLICTANFLQPGAAPWHVGLLIALGVAASVGVMHSAAVANLQYALLATAGLCAVLLALSIDLWSQGLHVCRHFNNRTNP
jgi:hypothetical protein